jgi:GNAT superfamily N-acetyltransferase
MTAYRFCRSDDITLLSDALNRCWLPYFPDEPPMTPAAFKRSIRDLQVWSSSCMVAFSGSDPIGVLIGAKRPSGTLIHKIAVHPDHRRQGHAHHLLTSLGSKLAILGPPRIVVEVPETLSAACELFSASEFAQEALLTDYVFQPTAHTTRSGGPRQREGRDAPEAAGMSTDAFRAEADDHDGRFVIPVTVDDLAANGLAGEAHPQHCWTRSVETLTAMKDDIAGLAIASDERIEAYLLYQMKCEEGAEGNAEANPRPSALTQGPHDPFDATRGEAAEILTFRTFTEHGGAHLKQLFARLLAHGIGTFRFPKVHPEEVSKECLEALGFRAAAVHRLYAASARPG